MRRLQNESDRMNRKLNAFRKVFDSALNITESGASVFKTRETFESILAMLKVDFPEIKFQLHIDSKISPENYGESSVITDLIHGVAVLLLQHQSSHLTLKVQLSQVIAESQFVDIVLEATNCSIDKDDLIHLFRPRTKSKGSSQFITSLSFELSRKLIHLKEIEPLVETSSSNRLDVTIYDVWKSFSDTDISKATSKSEKVLENLHLLIVEDDKLNQIVTAMMIKNFGCTCDIANDGIEALDIFSPSVHQCILMDIEMPRMDGYACTNELRKQYGNDLPIIALSAYNEEERTSTYTSHGLNNFLLKRVKKICSIQRLKRPCSSLMNKSLLKGPAE